MMDKDYATKVTCAVGSDCLSGTVSVSLEEERSMLRAKGDWVFNGGWMPWRHSRREGKTELGRISRPGGGKA